MCKIIAFAGSNHSGSINHTLVQYATKQIKNIDIKLVDLREFDVPIYSINLELNQGIPDSIRQLKKIIQYGDGFIIASPEHNGSIPAFFKNIIDWLSRIDQNIFNNKPVVLLSASPGVNGGRTNLEHLAQLMPFWGAQIIDRVSIGRFNQYRTKSTLELPEEILTQLQEALQKFENSVWNHSLQKAC